MLMVFRYILHGKQSTVDNNKVVGANNGVVCKIPNVHRRKRHNTAFNVLRRHSFNTSFHRIIDSADKIVSVQLILRNRAKLCKNRIVPALRFLPRKGKELPVFRLFRRSGSSRRVDIGKDGRPCRYGNNRAVCRYSCFYTNKFEFIFIKNPVSICTVRPFCFIYVFIVFAAIISVYLR